MIISHKHKFIFLRTQKTAGVSIEIALARICGPNDVITKLDGYYENVKKKLGYPTRQNFLIPAKHLTFKQNVKKLIKRGRPPQYFNHISAEILKKYIDEKVWDSYYKFCFERNPWDKMISWYYWANQSKNQESILEFLKQSKELVKKGYFIYTIDDEIVVDNIYKYEEMEEALFDLSQRFDLDEQLKLPRTKFHSNTRKDKRPYQEVLTEAEAEFISQLFKNEINHMGYKFDD